LLFDPFDLCTSRLAQFGERAPQSGRVALVLVAYRIERKI
jgi:hypothetical protein